MELFPHQASSFAHEVDALYAYLLGIAVFFSGLIFSLIIAFSIRYRRRPGNEHPPQIKINPALEIIWSVIPLFVVLSVFFWGVKVFLTQLRPPPDAEEIFVVGKQWMWKLQHPEGHREINELHVPLGRPVRLTLTSEDVIHSFYIPAFRTKMDAVPGRYTQMWFNPTRLGEFHLFCAEYCGTKHSQMIGRVIVMSPADYAAWLEGNAPAESMAEAGGRLFEQMACNTCHKEQPDARGPSLEHVWGSTVTLQDGQQVVVDETYVRESILKPQAKLVRGYTAIMPTYKGQLTEEQVLQLIAYVKSLAGPEGSKQE